MSPSTERRALIIHGYGATPRDHWFPWLAGRLSASGLPTTVVGLPSPETPDPAAWDAALTDELRTHGRPTAVVAHSLGCLSLLHRLSADPWPLERVVLVAGFVDRLPGLPELDDFIGTAGAGVDRATVRAYVGAVTVLRSDDDPVVPTGHTDRLASLLGTRATVVPRAGHFLAEDGVTRLPEAAAAVSAVGTATASPRRPGPPGTERSRSGPAPVRGRPRHSCPS